MGGLNGHRRSLLTISGILVFLKYAKVEITEFTILGIKFSSFKHPDSVFLALWIFWFYFAICYYQYFMQEGLPKSKETFIKILDEKSRKVISAIVKKEYPKDRLSSVTYHVLKGWGWKYHGEIFNEDGGLELITKFEMKISIIRLIPVLLYSFIMFAINRSALMDYFLPLAFAIFTISYCFTGWNGGLLVTLKHLF